MVKPLLFLSMLLLLCGCIAKTPIVLPTEPVPKLAFVHPTLPRPVSLVPPTFYILTQTNSQSYFENSAEGVVFAVTPQGYEILSSDVQELRRYILELQNVIKTYKKLTSAESLK